MARARKASADIGHNNIQPAVIVGFTDRIEGLLDDLATAKGEYMRKARTIRDDIATVYGEAKDAGIPKKEFRAVIKTRSLENKLDALRDDLENEQRETYDQIRRALGDLADLPLGGAALNKHPDAPRPAS